MSNESDRPLRVGQMAPAFELPSIAGSTEATAQLADYAGKWLMLLFYPRDFTFVCPTELVAFSARVEAFTKRNCELLAISVDSIETHRNWLEQPSDTGGVGPLRFGLASDEDGRVSRAYQVYDEDLRVAGRGLFLIDPEGTLQYQLVHSMAVGRSPTEVLRVLDALQAGGLCPATWTRADGTIDPALHLHEGRVLGHYRIKKKLGRGGFAEVYHAWDLWLQRDVALKVLKGGQKADIAVTLAEARLAAALAHPNICTVYTVEEADGLPLIAMEYLVGETLHRRMRDQGPLPGREVVRVTLQIASAIAAAHGAGIVHGDLKSSNIIITPSQEQQVKVLDFGLATRALNPANERLPSLAALDDSEHWSYASLSEGQQSELSEHSQSRDESSSTSSSSRWLSSSRSSSPLQSTGDAPEPDRKHRLRGTPAFMSPEQARGEDAIAASDVFTLGLVLYQMLTGKRAVRGKRGEPMQAVLELLSTDMSTRAEDAPAPFQELLRASLARHPDDRPTMSAVVNMLRGT